MIYHYITFDGNTTTEKTKPSLSKMQDWVGGYIQIVKCNFNGKFCQLVINEEGLLLNLPINIKASLLFGNQIVGNAIVFERELRKGKKSV